MSKFVLPCNSCGSSMVIARTQAGMSIPCDGCGVVLQVPTIRNFGSLKQVEAETPVAATPKRSLWLSWLAAIAFIAGAGSLAYTGTIGWEHYNLLNQVAAAKMDLTKNEEDYVRDVRTESYPGRHLGLLERGDGVRSVASIHARFLSHQAVHRSSAASSAEMGSGFCSQFYHFCCSDVDASPSKKVVRSFDLKWTI